MSGRTDELKPVAPIYSYAGVSLSNVIATTCQYEALKWVSFAVQTLGKCAKMFPVMIWGFLMLGKRYTGKEVGLAVSITSGCFIFFMTGNTVSRIAGEHSNSSFVGILLMLGYLGADGFTSTVQDQMFKGFQMTTYNQVLYVSLCSMAFSSFGEWRRLCVASRVGCCAALQPCTPLLGNRLAGPVLLVRPPAEPDSCLAQCTATTSTSITRQLAESAPHSAHCRPLHLWPACRRTLLPGTPPGRLDLHHSALLRRHSRYEGNVLLAAACCESCGQRGHGRTV